MRAAPAFEYFDHDADVGVIGRGDDLTDAFVAAAQATFALTCDIASVAPRERIDIAFDEADPEFALVTWLNLLLARANERGLALGRFELRRDGDRWAGAGWGEHWRDDIERRTQVKGATLTMLEVTERGGRWEARCVVDV
jgi:SHS2 domain-containing protein